MSLGEDLTSWILENLSVEREWLANQPPCPFAREALLKNRMEVFEVNPKELFSRVRAQLDAGLPLEKEIIVFAAPKDSTLDSAACLQFVTTMREHYFSKNLWLLIDHPEVPEVLHGEAMNFGTHVLLLVQQLSHLVQASEKLKAIGYYDRWPRDYHTEVVANRRQYYDRYLGQLKSLEASHG